MSITRSVLSELSHKNRWAWTLHDVLVDCQWKMSQKRFNYRVDLNFTLLQRSKISHLQGFDFLTTLNNLNFTEQSIKKRSKFDNWKFRINVELEPRLLCLESSTLLKTISTLVIYLVISIQGSHFSGLTKFPDFSSIFSQFSSIFLVFCSNWKLDPF